MMDYLVITEVYVKSIVHQAYALKLRRVALRMLLAGDLPKL